MGFAAEQRERTRPVMPLAAMIDVLFLLLIFFMTISAFREQERDIDVELQQTQSEAAGTSPTAIIITVKDDGNYYIGDRPHTLDSLDQTLGALAEQWAEEQVIIRADKASPSGNLIAAIDVAKAAGFARVSLAGAQPTGE